MKKISKKISVSISYIGMVAVVYEEKEATTVSVVSISYIGMVDLAEKIERIFKNEKSINLLYRYGRL